MEFIQIEGDLKTACIQIAAKPNEDDEAPVATARSVYKLQIRRVQR